ncbi:MAG: hypothetical protein IKA41_08815 [Bacteroidaceae bacterium]|nr:hypothetical protein [Bacteroidaceae bacterium]
MLTILRYKRHEIIPFFFCEPFIGSLFINPVPIYIARLSGDLGSYYFGAAKLNGPIVVKIV